MQKVTPQTNREMLTAITKTFEENSRKSARALMEHQKEDIEHFKRIEDKMEHLATKEDIKEMKEAFEDFTRAVGFLKLGGKVSYRILLILATIIVSVVAIGGGFKTILGWFKL